MTFEEVKNFFATHVASPDIKPFICRVFAQKFKDEAEHLSLEQQATAEEL